MSIKVLRLLSGEEVVVEMGAVTKQLYTIKNPLAVVPQQQQNGNIGFGFLPWCMFAADDSFEVNSSVVVTVYSPRPEILNGYEQTMHQVRAAKSGLVVPQAPKLIVE